MHNMTVLVVIGHLRVESHLHWLKMSLRGMILIVFVNNEHAAASEIGHLAGRRAEASIQTVVAMAADHDKIDVKFLACAQEAAPWLSLLNDRWFDGEIGTTRGKFGEMLG